MWEFKPRGLRVGAGQGVEASTEGVLGVQSLGSRGMGLGFGALGCDVRVLFGTSKLSMLQHMRRSVRVCVLQNSGSYSETLNPEP